MAKPDLKVEVGFGYSVLTALASISWTDITAYVDLDQATLTTRRGRATERDQIEAGTLALTLRDPDRRFDPGNVLSPYYPNVRPRARIRVSLRYPAGSGSYTPIWTGYVASWEPYTVQGQYAGVKVRASDALAVLQRQTFTSLGGGPGETTANAFGNILNLTGWPGADRNIAGDSGTTLPARTYDAAITASALQDIARTDNAVMYVDGQGRLTWHDRAYRARNQTILSTFSDERDPTTGWVLGNSSVSILGQTTIPRPSGWVAGTRSGILYQRADLAIDDRQIRNDVRMTRSGGTAQVATDAASQAAYGIMTYSETGLLLQTDGEAANRATWFLARYKDPVLRADTLVVIPDLQPADAWPAVLARDIDDLVRVVKRPPPRGWIALDCRIESVSFALAKTVWQVTYQLSPNDPTTYWRLEDATYGVLDFTTRLAY